MKTGFFICLIVSINALFLLIWYFTRYRVIQIRKEEQKKAEISKQIAEMERQVLLAQMNPHFIFNSLNSIQGFILKNNVDEAIRYLHDFARTIRHTLDNVMQGYITLDRELEDIRLYLNHQLMKCDKKFEVEIHLPENLNPQNIHIPPMIIQPYIENAIRHGILHKNNGAGLILLDFSVEAENLKCVIQDNGVAGKNPKR